MPNESKDNKPSAEQPAPVRKRADGRPMTPFETAFIEAEERAAEELSGLIDQIAANARAANKDLATKSKRMTERAERIQRLSFLTIHKQDRILPWPSNRNEFAFGFTHEQRNHAAGSGWPFFNDGRGGETTEYDEDDLGFEPERDVEPVQTHNPQDPEFARAEFLYALGFDEDENGTPFRTETERGLLGVEDSLPREIFERSGFSADLVPGAKSLKTVVNGLKALNRLCERPAKPASDKDSLAIDALVPFAKDKTLGLVMALWPEIATNATAAILSDELSDDRSGVSLEMEKRGCLEEVLEACSNAAKHSFIVRRAAMNKAKEGPLGEDAWNVFSSGNPAECPEGFFDPIVESVAKDPLFPRVAQICAAASVTGRLSAAPPGLAPLFVTNAVKGPNGTLLPCLVRASVGNSASAEVFHRSLAAAAKEGAGTRWSPTHAALVGPQYGNVSESSGVSSVCRAAALATYRAIDPSWRGHPELLGWGRSDEHLTRHPNTALATAVLRSSGLFAAHNQRGLSRQMSAVVALVDASIRKIAAEEVPLLWPEASRKAVRIAIEAGINKRSVLSRVAALSLVAEQTPALLRLGLGLLGAQRRVKLSNSIAKDVKAAFKASGMTEAGWKLTSSEPSLLDAAFLCVFSSRQFDSDADKARAKSGASLFSSLVSESAACQDNPKAQANLLAAALSFSRFDPALSSLETVSDMESLSSMSTNQEVSIRAKTIEAAEIAFKREKDARAGRRRILREAASVAVEQGWPECAGQWRLISDWASSDKTGFSQAVSTPDCSWESLMRRQEAWHKAQIDSMLAARGGGWKPLVDSVTSPDGSFIALELCSAKALHEEGQGMRHCVGSYAQRCQAGESAVFSIMRKVGEGAFSRVATLELAQTKTSRPAPSDGRGARANETATSWRFSQIKGKCNQVAVISPAFLEEITSSCDKASEARAKAKKELAAEMMARELKNKAKENLETGGAAMRILRNKRA